MYLLGYDMGSSTIKVALVDASSHQIMGLVQYPDQEMDMISRQRGWAEQQPEVWWQNLCIATRRILSTTGVRPRDIKGIGISYQMHGLVMIDKDQQVLRPSIIWCDSRAVPIGQQAYRELGKDYCLKHLFNSPGNFTASKLKWVKDNEPQVYDRADKILLPGDYIAMRLTGQAVTTLSGLSEGIFWNFKEQNVASKLLEYYGISDKLLPPTVPTFSIQGRVTKRAAEQTGLIPGIPVTYRAGDQPNNALSLNVLNPGEVAATSGTSGVVYGLVTQPVSDNKARINSFAHVNYEDNFDRIGVLLCLNGAGIEYSWIKHQVAHSNHAYDDMERMASTVPVGADGLCLLPFGNGAERMLEDRNINAHIFNLDFNRHTRAHIYRASLEGVAFSFIHGINILKELGLNVDVIRVGNDNMFRSKIFSRTIATILGSQIELVETTGAVGAAKAAGVSVGIYQSLDEALEDVRPTTVFDPELDLVRCQQAYNYWESKLNTMMEDQSKNRTPFISPVLLEKNKKLKTENQQIRKKLTETRLQLNTLHELVAELRQTIKKNERSTEPSNLSTLLQKIESQISNGEDWESFEEAFDMLHNDFFKKLSAHAPELSRQDLKMCAYLKMKLSTKEIARRLNLSIRGAETSRYRLRKKLNLNGRENLNVFLEKMT